MSKTVDMTEGKIAMKLLLFTLPMILSAVFQQLYNIVDSVVAGYISQDALASVGSSGTVTYLYVAIGNGCAAGAAVIIAQYFGAKNYEKLKSAMTTAILTILGLSAILTTLGLVYCNEILTFMHTSEEIFANSASYLSIYLYGLTFMFIYNICNGIFTSLGDSRTPLYFLIFSSVLNVVLDIIFAVKLGWGVEGLAWATTIAQCVSSLLSIGNLARVFIKIKSQKYPIFDTSIFKKIVKVSIPSILQQSVVSIGQLGVQRIINGFATGVIAGYTAAGKISGIFTMAICTISTAISKYTGQNYGAKRYDRIKDGYRVGNIMSITVAVVAVLVMAAFATPLLKVFGKDAVTQEMIDAGKTFLFILSPFYTCLALKVVADGCVQGCLKMKAFVIGTFIDLAVRVGLAYALAPIWGFTGVCLSFSLGWLIGGIASIVVYKIVVVKDIIKANAIVPAQELKILVEKSAAYEAISYQEESETANI